MWKTCGKVAERKKQEKGRRKTGGKEKVLFKNILLSEAAEKKEKVENSFSEKF